MKRISIGGMLSLTLSGYWMEICIFIVYLVLFFTSSYFPVDWIDGTLLWTSLLFVLLMIVDFFHLYNRIAYSDEILYLWNHQCSYYFFACIIPLTWFDTVIKAHWNKILPNLLLSLEYCIRNYKKDSNKITTKNHDQIIFIFRFILPHFTNWISMGSCHDATIPYNDTENANTFFLFHFISLLFSITI